MARRGENIRKRKDGRWEGRYIKARTSEGKIQWGYVYGTVYAEVKRVLIQKKAEAGFYKLKRTDLTFEALAEVWLHSLRNSIKESTYAHYSYTLHKYLLPVLSKAPVASLEESFLEQAMQQIIVPTDAAHTPLGNSSARECLSMLRRICKYAAHLRLIRPMELEVALPKAIDKISAPLSPVEQQRLYHYVQENPTPRKIGLLLGLELGLRIGEICGLQWGDFDLKLGTLKINRTVCRISCGDARSNHSAKAVRYSAGGLETRHLCIERTAGCKSVFGHKEFSHSFNEKVETIRKAKAEMNRQRDCLNNLDVEHLPWIEDFKSYQNLTSLNRRVLVELVESITVYDKEHIHIQYRFDQEIRNVLEYCSSVPAAETEEGAV